MEPATRQTNQNRINILAVEDDKVITGFLAVQIKDLGHTLHVVEDGRSALDFLNSNPDIDVVLMDWEMPVMDGLSAVRHMKNSPRLRNVPVIMLTGADKPEDMKKGLEAGVFYYLTKPVKKAILHSVLESAVRTARQTRVLAQEMKQHRMSFELIDSCKFRLRTLGEAESIAVFIANCFPEPERVLPGLGELLVNAIEHGNLGIGYDRKTELVDADTWRAEIERLQKLPENADKCITVTIARKEDGIYAIIEDEGEGFNWKSFMQVDPASAGRHHGRGIAQANAVSFDRLTYNDKGNKAVGFVGYGRKLDW